MDTHIKDNSTELINFCGITYHRKVTCQSEAVNISTFDISVNLYVLSPCCWLTPGFHL